MPILTFPSTLRKKPVPFVAFTPYPARQSSASGGMTVFLPMPPGIAFGDSMSYSTIDLGVIGQIGAETLSQMSGQNSIAAAAGAAAGGLAGSVVDKAKKFNAAAAASIAAKKLGASSVSNLIDYSTKQVIAPNTNSAFQNTSVRQFQFTFKMVSKSKKEAQDIDRIVNIFRIGMYPKGNDVILEYPSVWKIDFNNSDGSKNTFIPKIFSCYLTSMNAVYNGGTNLYHTDGSPIETDITLQFQETRALTQEDILELGGEFSRRR